MRALFVFVGMLLPALAFSDDPVDLTGTWVIVSAVVNGSPVDEREFKDYVAVVGETTWVEVDHEGGKKTTYFHKVEVFDGQTRLTLCHDAELKDIEALAIVREWEGGMEFCVVDYARGVAFPKEFVSTAENRHSVFRLKRKEP
jgi:hypothetical protein